MMKYFVYMLTDKKNAKLYIGVTNDIRRRLREHKNESADGYTKRYHLHKLVYYEEISSPQDAIAREKQLKGWLRAKKNALIASVNPDWDECVTLSGVEISERSGEIVCHKGTRGLAR